MDHITTVVVVGAICAGFVQGLSGFAFGLTAMSFWAWTLDPKLAAALAVFGALTGQVIAALTVRRGFNVRQLLPLCPAMLLAGNLPRIKAGGKVADAFVGGVGGVMGGIGGFTGTIPTLWCTLRGFAKDEQRAIIQNFNLAALAVTMSIYVAKGIVTRDMLPMFAIVAPAMLVPTLLGARMYVGISEATFRKVVLSLLTASGIALLAASVPALVAR